LHGRFLDNAVLGALFGRFLVMREIVRSIHQREMQKACGKFPCRKYPVPAHAPAQRRRLPAVPPIRLA
jgi:hypothetical protein